MPPIECSGSFGPNGKSSFRLHDGLQGRHLVQQLSLATPHVRVWMHTLEVVWKTDDKRCKMLRAQRRVHVAPELATGA